jgi:alkylation response protein AidB-like acyl-CoA dehydrogenase
MAHAELRELRSAIQDFLEDERAAGVFEPRCDSWMRSFDRGFSQRLAANGWLGITWPTEYGGGGQSHRARLIVTEELLRAGAPVAAHWIAERQIGPAIVRYGSDALKQELLAPIAAGDVTFCLGMSEPEAGSDLAAVRTLAVRDGADYRITGAKIWTTNAHHAEYAYVLACTDREAEKDARLTEFVVDMDAPGVEVRPIYDLAGEHHFNEVLLDDVPVPAGRVIGDVGRGWAQVTAQLAFERGGPERFLSAYPLLEALVRHVADGDAADGATGRVGELIGRLRGLRALNWRIAELMDAGVAPVAPAAMLKMLGTRFEQDIVEFARWLLETEPDPTAGDLGAMLGDVQLAMPGISLRGGATEILAGIVARNPGGRR